MKQFKRVEPTELQTFGKKYLWTAVIKYFETGDGQMHEFTTIGNEGTRAGAVIALTPSNQVIITYQFRAGPERWMYDLPGGGFNDDEDSQMAALRELKEETGYEPGHVEYLGESCREAYVNTTWHYYLATDCFLSAEGQMLDETEEQQGAEVRLITISELIENAKHNNMTDPHAVLMAYDKLKQLESND